MKYFLILFSVFFSSLNAQNVLKFDKKNVQCEDKWVCIQMNKDSIYNFGFIYIDATAGLTLNYEGGFKIDKKGGFVRTDPKEKRNSSLKVRLEPNRVLFAEIPEGKFKELEIEKTPNWLSNYKNNENSIERLYRWGFLYNGYQEIEKALTYLEKAEKINPNFKGLQTELAYSYNALGQYEKAEIALQKDLKNNPDNCYTLKELAYTYNHMNRQDKSIEVYINMAKICSNKQFVQETAYNLAYKYFEKKDKPNFEKWNQETKKWSEVENQYSKNLKAMEIDINK